MFHDFSRLREASQKTIDFTTVPVLVKGGVFHPKLIVVSGKKTNSPDERLVRVMISSANLTYAGWGSNLEAGGVIEVRDRHQAEPLVILLQWLLERATEAVDDKKTISFIERFNTVITFLQDRMNVEPTDNSPLVHVTIPDHVGHENPPGLQPLLQWLLHRRTGDLVIAAPYFSGQKFFEEIAQEFAGRAITIAPGVSQGNLVEFDTETLEYLENSRFKLARLEQPKGDDEDRRQHLKCFAHKNGVIVGSHNASYHALGSALEHGPGPKNVEVSVEFPGRSIGHMIHSTKPGELKPKNDPSEPPLPVPWAGKVPILVLTVDWKERLITLRQIAGGDSEPAQYGIKFPGVDLPISLDTFDIKERNGVLKLEHVDAKSLAETKKFEVHALAETPSFRYVGFINETNREERDRRYESTLADCWRSYIAPLDRDLKPSLNPSSGRQNTRCIIAQTSRTSSHIILTIRAAYFSRE